MVMVEYYKEQASNGKLVVEWLHALPLLHFLRKESKPFEDVICTKSIDFKSYKWWGLDKLPFRQIRTQVLERFVLHI